MQQLKEARAALEMQKQAAAATRIAAVQRGKQDRRKVATLKAQKASLEASGTAAVVVSEQTADPASFGHDLIAELNGLPVRDLRKRASEAGADGDAPRKHATHDPKSALITVIVEQAARATG